MVLSIGCLIGSSALSWVDVRTEAYRSDLSDAEWALIEPELTAWRAPRLEREVSGGSQPVHELREIVIAILYVNRTGCAWECLPRDSPPYKTVYGYFAAWRDDDTAERIHDLLRRRLCRYKLHLTETCDDAADTADPDARQPPNLITSVHTTDATVPDNCAAVPIYQIWPPGTWRRAGTIWTRAAPTRRTCSPPAASTVRLRKARYRGIKKVELEHYLGATAISTTRLDAYLTHHPLDRTH